MEQQVVRSTSSYCLLGWCEAFSHFSLGVAQNDSGRFQRESVFGHAIFRSLKELQMANQAVKYSARASWRGPSLCAFLLFAALQVIVLLRCVIDGLMTCCALGSILPQGLQFDRLLDLSIVRLGLSVSAHWEASLGPMFPSCRSASAHGCWRRVLRTPPPLLFLERGVPQVTTKKSIRMVRSTLSQASIEAGPSGKKWLM